MSDSIKKYIHLGEWCFELKAVRALKVDEYGEPYKAIANCNINGDAMYVDGLLTKDGETFTKDDFKTFLRFAEMLGLENFCYHRFQQGNSVHRNVELSQQKSDSEQPNKSQYSDRPYIKLVE